jgi:hypothetical protein
MAIYSNLLRHCGRRPICNDSQYAIHPLSRILPTQ